MATHGHNNEYYCTLEPNSVKPLHQCVEKRHFTRLQTLCWLSRVIDRWREFNPVGKKQGEGRIRGRRRASAFIAYRRTWLTVIASDLEGIVSISKKL